ncbi:DUF418 domain-containing protein [Aquiflexum sp. LQ15W]|uniref:DUF418 domain-containing protein n=1 Tax=Cognataquiflexum nitidum TaxID=2922272 RepID=UPI001F13C774|nr:DUF418 domain-containing protein [Cognataquiflexum nitidum]MCH6198251.1 DUF418 domain-containing protein [Cognataquiflexum nitidum]
MLAKEFNSTLISIETAERVTSLDVMRGIVLCGILLMNINGFGLSGAYNDPTVSGGAEGWNLGTWVAANMFFEGTMRALFSLLFGVGMFILLDRLEKKDAGIRAADIYFRRLLWLLVFGLVHGYLLLWRGEILFEYALMGYFVYSFRRISPKYLVMISVFLFSIGTLWNYVDYRKDVAMMDQVALAETYKVEETPLSKETKDALSRWEQKLYDRSQEFIDFENESMRKGYVDVVFFLAPVNTYFNTYFSYRYDLWDILPMMLLGIALFKWKILSTEKSYGFYGLMVLFGYGIGLLVNYNEITSIIASDFSYVGFSKSNITYDLGRIPVAMGHIGMIMVFSKLPAFEWLKHSLAAVGKMALTNYLMHSVICMFVFTGVGFGLFGKLQRFELLYVVFSIWIFQMILSPIWLKYFHFGPIEWMWRRLSYLQNPPFWKV